MCWSKPGGSSSAPYYEGCFRYSQLQIAPFQIPTSTQAPPPSPSLYHAACCLPKKKQWFFSEISTMAFHTNLNEQSSKDVFMSCKLRGHVNIIFSSVHVISLVLLTNLWYSDICIYFSRCLFSVFRRCSFLNNLKKWSSNPKAIHRSHRLIVDTLTPMPAPKRRLHDFHDMNQGKTCWTWI